MFSKHRLSRGPEQPTNASALAAASAIGRALGSNGKSVDKSKIPEYNRSPGYGSRSPSLQGSRRSSLQMDGPLGNRSNSASKTSSPVESSIEGIRRRTSIKSSNRRSNSYTRSHSLQGAGGAIARNRSLRNGVEDHNSDPQAAFKEFGDHQTGGVVHGSGNERPVTIKKYIPTSHGLVAVDVPIEEHLEQQRRHSFLRRSTSSNSLSVSRQNSLTRKGNQQSHTGSQQKRHSSLTNSSVNSQSHRSRQINDQPLIQTHLQEETEQELTQDVIRPLRIPRDDYAKKTAEVKAPDHDEKRAGLHQAGTTQDVGTKPTKTEDVKRAPETEIDTDSLKPTAVAPSSNTLPEVDVSEVQKTSEEPGNVGEDAETETIVQAAVPIKVTPVPETVAEADDPDLETKEESQDDLFDASDIIEPEPSEISNSVPQTNSEPSTAPTLAQHLRAVNPYLNQPESASRGRTEEADAQVAVKSEAKALFKVPSPMKSALKKTNTHSSTTSSIYSENSPANQAYLSLTTAENTRLNAKLASSENLVQRQNSKHLTRPHSVANPPNYRSVSPSPRESTRVKRHSAIQKSAENRQSVYKPNNEQKKSPATAAARTSASLNKARKDTVKNKALEHIKDNNDAKKRNNRNSKEVPDSILYPKEPPQKRSSFEKVRNQETHLGFKKLSLRDEGLMEATSEQNNYSSGYRSNIPTTPSKHNVGPSSQEANQAFLENSGWKSRFHDSDSEDEAAPFSSTGTSRSTQPTATSANIESPASGSKGFSLFKSKGKAQNENAGALVPPQPAFMEAEKSSANSTPNKINKKWSKLSLRSSSTADAYDTQTEGLRKTVTQEKRYHSNSKVEGFSYDGMKERTFREDRVASVDTDNQTVKKKKKKFGTKLKKLFGREK